MDEVFLRAAIGIVDAGTQALRQPAASFVMADPALALQTGQGICRCVPRHHDHWHIADLGHQVVVPPVTALPQPLAVIARDDQVALTLQAVEVGEDLGEQAIQVMQRIVVGIGLALDAGVRPGGWRSLVPVVLRIGQVRGTQIEHHEVARRPALFVEDSQQGTILAVQETQRMVLSGDGHVQIATAQVRQQLGFLGRQPVGAKAGGLGEAEQVDLASAQSLVLARLADGIQ